MFDTFKTANAGTINDSTSATNTTTPALSADMGAAVDQLVSPVDFDLPPGKVGEFLIPHGAVQDASPQQEADAARYVSTWFELAQMPREIGTYLLDEMAVVAKRHQAMSEAERELYKREQTASLYKIWGDEGPRKLALAKQLLDEIDARQPGLAELLDETGAANSATVILQLASHAERLAARRGG